MKTQFRYYLFVLAFVVCCLCVRVMAEDLDALAEVTTEDVREESKMKLLTSNDKPEVATPALTSTPTKTPTPTPMPTPVEMSTSVPTLTSTLIASDISTAMADDQTEGKLQTASSEEEIATSIRDLLKSPILAGIVGALCALFGMTIFSKGKRKKKKETVTNSQEATLDMGRGAPDNKPAETEKTVRIQASVINTVGRVRKNNEDSFYMNGVYMEKAEMDAGAQHTKKFDGQYQIYAVCDGMGGADAGEEASFAAVSGLASRNRNLAEFTDEVFVRKIFQDISNTINQEAKKKGIKSGTTIVLVAFDGKKALFSNVGDSRIYQFRQQKLVQISKDHSKVQKKIAMGLITPEQARTDSERHVITQFLGIAGENRISPYFVSEKNVLRGDVYLLCSDGLTDMLTDVEMEKILSSSENIKKAAQALCNAAMAKGGRDNTTIMLLQIL